MTAPAARRTLGNVLIPVLPDLWLPVSLASTCSFPVQQPIQSFRSRHRRAHIVCLERVLLGFFPNPETRFVSVGEPTCFICFSPRFFFSATIGSSFTKWPAQILAGNPHL